jgi:O-antigen ligase
MKTMTIKRGLWVLAGFLLALQIWYGASKGIVDVLLWGSGCYAAYRWRRVWPHWRCVSGVAFLGFAGLVLLLLPLATRPELAGRDLVKIGKVVAGVLGVTALFDTRDKLRRALLYSAAALTLVLGADLLRLALLLGSSLLAEGRYTEPFILNHPNVASMMAIFSFWVWVSEGYRCREEPRRLLLRVALALLCVVYLVALASRGPQLAFAVSLAVACLLGPVTWRNRALAAGGYGLIALLVVLNASRIAPRFLETETMRTFSSRDQVWRRTATLCAQRPLLGYGYGKKSFDASFRATQPPPAWFHYPHAHQYWLKNAFEFGLLGVALLAVAWGALAGRLILYIWRRPWDDQRVLALTVASMLVAVHAYGMGDFPDGIVEAAQLWLIAAALIVTGDGVGRRRDATPRAEAPA